MFVKFYKYKIKKENFDLWKKINNKTRIVFRHYGVISKRLFKKDKQFVHIIEMDSYASKKEYLKISKQTDKDPHVKSLFKEFIKVVYRKKIFEEDFETI